MLKKTTYLFLAILFLGSCSKEEGEGGLASIEGKVFGYYVNKNEVVLDSAYVGEKRVYISYGDETFVDDETRTSYDGSYKFSGLTKGDYTLFVYSKCNSCPFEKETKTMRVTIAKNKEKVILADIKIKEE